MMRITLLLLVITTFSACSTKEKENTETLYVIHAGSLTLPVKEISKAFSEENPGVKILTEAWGSKAAARRVADLDTPADVFLSADYNVIENMLIPEHASWYLPFATNEIGIVFTDHSIFADSITNENWMDILADGRVKFGRSNPDMDPCGVRSALIMQLTGIMKKDTTIYTRLINKDRENIRPKETDLIGLLESRQVDYIFLYKSVAQQHGLRYLELSDSLNLGSFNLNPWYSRASIVTKGTSPSEVITETGMAMVYALTIPHKSQNKNLAEKFAAFVIDEDKGQAILRNLGQDPVQEFTNPYSSRLPQLLKNTLNGNPTE